MFIMKRLIYTSVFICFILFFTEGCQEADKLMFHELNALSVRVPRYDQSLLCRGDTVTYSFAFENVAVTEKTIKIPVEAAGFAKSYDRTYHIALTLGKDVVNGVNFKELTTEQTIHAEMGIDTLEVTLYRTKDILEGSKLFKLELVEGGDFVLGIEGVTSMIIRFSDVLEEPAWWVNWKKYFGPFHRIKYQEWMRIWGGTGDLTGSKYWGGISTAPKEIMAIKELQKYFEENPRYTNESAGDPNNLGERIVIPCPL